MSITPTTPRRIWLEDLLGPLGLEPSKSLRLVRHQDTRHELTPYELLCAGRQHFEVYQRVQGAAAFRDSTSIVSFVGRAGTTSLFVGVYRVKGSKPATRACIPRDFPMPMGLNPTTVFYDLARDGRFEDMEQRLVVDWGTGTRAWIQRFREQTKPVLEVLPLGYTGPFPGYLDFALSFHELHDVITHEAANRDWHRMLSAVAGIYLILDSATGKQYVGSACGAGGVLGRWTSYARTGHGDNVQLVALLQSDPQAKARLVFSLLQVLPGSLAPPEVRQREQLCKRKLGSRAHGFNSN